ncbi:hypothetical protein HYH03_000537 [Edaphochlamys debaryana]|uniref:Sel1 repeat family protein n=1 Tax=Edaphochlamys debaryana TaxID=47281 RepID=A0A835YIW2_9CHLO|nr:hypothetical protein HYH03_000537 [Edaphochlamys debaryana]|eukprot:KAG2502043.1 hypothetical protein HYH03_000537 [Edaphochlamys debaryana]
MWLLLAGSVLCSSGAAAIALLDSKRRRNRHAQRHGGEGAAQSEEAPSTGNGEEEVGTSGRDDGGDSRGPLQRLVRSAGFVAGAGTLLALVCGTLLVTRLRRRSNAREGSGRGNHPRIPLKELVRFREQQWFLEELEGSRDGDPNAMLRLAKMYLYGQGCERSVQLANEWLRRARAGGVYCTLDELLTDEDLAAIRRQAKTHNAERLQAQRQAQQAASRQPQSPGSPRGGSQSGLSMAAA